MQALERERQEWETKYEAKEKEYKDLQQQMYELEQAIGDI